METLFSDSDQAFRERQTPAAESENPYQPPQYVGEEYPADYARPGQRGVLWILFSFEGRIPRRVFWAAVIITRIMFYVAFFLLAEAGDDFEIAGPGFFLLYALAIWVILAITAKRWHDRDKSGWWILISLVPIVGLIWQFIETGCLRGTIGTNQYGPDPT